MTAEQKLALEILRRVNTILADLPMDSVDLDVGNVSVRNSKICKEISSTVRVRLSGGIELTINLDEPLKVPHE